MRRLILAAVIALTGAPIAASPVHAVQVVTPGSIVRLTLSDGTAPIEGVISSMSTDAWEVASLLGPVRTVSPSELSAAEVQVSRRNTLKGTLIGGGVGLVGGLLIVATSDDNCDRDTTGICDAFAGVAETAALVWAPAAGAAVGALVGTMVTSNRWVPAVGPVGPSDTVGFIWSLSTGHGSEQSRIK